MLSLSEEQLILKLMKRLDTYRFKNQIRENFYHGRNRIKSLNISIPPSMNKVRHSLGWNRIAIDALNDRLNFEGWSDEDETLGLNRIYDDNHLEAEAKKAQRDFLRYGVSYVFVSQGEDDEPDVLIHPASPNNAVAEYSLRKRRVINAVRVINDEGDVLGDLLTQTEVIPFAIRGGKLFADGPRKVHNLNRVPVVQMTNSGDSDSSKGHSDITDPMMSITDHALRTLLGLDIAREFYSYPQRYILGAPEAFMKDADGNPRNPFQAVMSAVWNVPRVNKRGQAPDPPPVVGQFATNDPRAFIEPLRFLAQEFASTAALPEYMLGVSPEANPTSADAIRAGEAQLIRRATDRKRQLTRPWAEVGRLAILLRDGQLPDDFSYPATLWGEIGTVNPAAASDRAVKLAQAGVLQPDSQIILTELGYSRKEQELIRRENNAASAASIRKMLESAPVGDELATAEVAEAANAGG